MQMTFKLNIREYKKQLKISNLFFYSNIKKLNFMFHITFNTMMSQQNTINKCIYEQFIDITRNIFSNKNKQKLSVDDIIEEFNLLEPNVLF